MRVSLLSITMACQVLFLASQSLSQTPTLRPERVHFSASFPQGHGVLFALSASDAKRTVSSSNGEFESVLQLRGDVEVRQTTCPPKNGGCVTSPMILHADAIDYNENTGQMVARGNVYTSFVEPTSKQPRLQGDAPEPTRRPILSRSDSPAPE
jgi:hypothetical protein